MGRLEIQGFVGDGSGAQVRVLTTVRQAPLNLPAPDEPTFFWFSSSSGSGLTKLYRTQDGFRVFATPSGRRAITVNTAGGEFVRDWWSVDIEAPRGRELAVGTYANTQRFGTDTVGGLDFSGNGHGCNQSFGQFTVRELVFGPSNTVARLRFTFEHHCEGPSAPPTIGEVWVVNQ